MSSVLQELEAEHTTPDGVTFDGRGGELFVVYIVNILLTLVTLGIYRFWGKTRIRQYVWSHLRYKGDAFEYTGKGLELFLGFLIVVFVVLLPLIGVSVWIQTLLMDGQETLAGILQIILSLAFACGFPLAIFRAYRYRLSRTMWRGIRFGLTGTARAYAAKYIGYTILQVVTLGLATPFRTVRLYDYLINNVWMGSGRFEFDGAWRPLMKPFLMFWVALVFSIVTFFAFVSSLSEAQMQQGEGAGFSIAALFVALTVATATFWLFYRYSAATYRLLVPAIRFGEVAFSAPVESWALFRLFFGNTLIVAFTFGLGFPWTITRVMNFMAQNLEIHGEPDFGKISQSTEEMPTYGEGLAEAFDIGGI